jgi:hypothetical protein
MSLKTLVENRDRSKETSVMKHLSGFEHVRHANSMNKWSTGSKPRFLGDDAPALLYCSLKKKGQFPNNVMLIFHTRVERPLTQSSQWRRIIKNFKVQEPSGYFRDKTKQHIAKLKDRFSGLLHEISHMDATKTRGSTGEGNDIRELTRLVKGLYTHMCDMQGTLNQVQERLARQETLPGGNAVCKCAGGGGDAAPDPQPTRGEAGEGVTREGARERSGSGAVEGEGKLQVGASTGAAQEAGAGTDSGARSTRTRMNRLLDPELFIRGGSAGRGAGGIGDGNPQVARNAIEPSPSPARKAAAGEVWRRMEASTSSESDNDKEELKVSGAPSSSPGRGAGHATGGMSTALGDSPQPSLTRRAPGDVRTDDEDAAPAQDYAQSPTWQEKADSFLRDHVVQKFYT